MVLLIVLAVAGFVMWTQLNDYEALPDQAAPVGAAPSAWRVFQPDQPTERGFIFYPGGLVDVDAYAWLGRALAKRGVFTVIVPMPLNLAILNPTEAEDVLKRYPAIKHWTIGGHSLGGTMAAQFLARHPEEAGRVDSLVLWGSRLSAGIDIATLPVTVVSIYGTNDGVAPEDITDAQRRAGLPATATLVPIAGGNHSMFGDYGQQKGDNPLAIDLPTAREQIIRATLGAIRKPRLTVHCSPPTVYSPPSTAPASVRDPGVFVRSTRTLTRIPSPNEWTHRACQRVASNGGTHESHDFSASCCNRVVRNACCAQYDGA